MLRWLTNTAQGGRDSCAKMKSRDSGEKKHKAFADYFSWPCTKKRGTLFLYDLNVLRKVNNLKERRSISLEIDYTNTM